MRKKIQEATASLAAVKEISMDAAFATVLSEGVFFVEKVFCFTFARVLPTSLIDS